MYKKAIRLIESGNYEESYFLFKEIVDFRDSRDYLSHFKICFDTKIFTGTNGSVVTTTHTYDSQGGLVKTVRSQAGEIWTHTYNGKGLLLEEKNEVMGEEFGYTHTIAYVYDNYGNLTEKLETTSDSNGNTDKDTVIYTRDNRGNVIKEVHTDIDGWVTTTTCTYDDLDNLLKKEEAFVGDHGTSLRTHVFSYNSQGKLTEEALTYTTNFGRKITVNSNATYIYDDNGHLIKKVEGAGETTTYAYDRYGNVAEKVETNLDGSTFMWTYTYDRNGKLLKEGAMAFQGFGFTNSYVYDRQGNLTKKVKASFNANDLVNTNTSTYDGYGNLIKSVTETAGGDVTTVEYTYDNYSNLVKEVTTQSDDDSRISTKTYEYTGIKVQYNP
ncbi:MAG: RHS repeat protein [Clostridia bacterium]|nr:RHS repeat protein [Clostridia bacterium]